MGVGRKQAFFGRWLGALILASALFLLLPGPAEASEQPPCATDRMTPAQQADTAGPDGVPSPFADPCAPAPSESSPLHPTGSIVRIDYPNDASLPALSGRLDVWEVDRQSRTVVALVTPEERAWLRRAGYAFAQDTELTAGLPDPRTFQLRTGAGIPGYACYRTVEETYADLAGLAAQHPNLAELLDIGDSWDKVTPGGPAGNDIYALVLTNKNRRGFEKGKLVVMAALHARELTTAEVATRFAEQLLAGYGTDPDLTWLLDFNEIHIITHANPDGRGWAEQGYLWRKNTDNPSACSFPNYGVDLNRNSSFLWNHCNGCSSSSVCSLLYRGPAPASEPETQAIEAYLLAVFGDQRGAGYTDPAPADTNGTFLSLHAYGRLIVYPWDHTGSPAPNRDELRRLGRRLGYVTRYSVCNTENCLYPVDGSTTDYAYGTLGVASYTYEIGRAFFESCATFESSIVEKNLKSLVYAAKTARRPYQMPAGPDVPIADAHPPRVTAGRSITLSATADDTRSASNGFGTEPAQAIAAVRYAIGAPGWLTDTAGSLQPVDGAFNSSAEFVTGSLDTTGLATGTHTIFIEAQDTSGQWGPPTALAVQVGGRFGLALSQNPATAIAIPGQTVTYTLGLTNTGDGPDALAVRALDPHSTVRAGRAELTLAQNETLALPVSVSVPTTATVGSALVSLIEISSLGDPSYRRTATLTTVVDVAGPGASDADVPPEMYLPLLSNK